MEPADAQRAAQAEAFLLRLMRGGNTSSAAVSITGGGIAAFLVGMIAIIGIVVSVAAVHVVQAERRADMREIETLKAALSEHRQRIEVLEIQRGKLESRIVILESER